MSDMVPVDRLYNNVCLSGVLKGLTGLYIVAVWGELQGPSIKPWLSLTGRKKMFVSINGASERERGHASAGVTPNVVRQRSTRPR